MMKRASCLLFSLLMLFFWGCPEPPSGISDDDNRSPNNNGRTTVRFVNNNGFPVDIFRDFSRQAKIAHVEPRGISGYVEWSPNRTGASFYPTYTIYIEDASFTYEGEVIIARVDEGKNNNVRVHLLSQLSNEEKAMLISTDTYIGIKNTSSYALSLRQGAVELSVEGSASPILNGGEGGAFRITPGPVSGYSIMRNTTTPLEFPSLMAESEFEPTLYYSFRYTGGDKLVLVEIKELTIADALR